MSVLDKIKRIEKNILFLQEMKNKYSLSEYLNKPELDWALRYGFFECIQIIIDISTHIVARLNLGTPEYYLESIEILHQNNILDDRLFASLIKIVGLRNKIVRDYDEVKTEQLYSYLDEIKDFKLFIESIGTYLN